MNTTSSHPYFKEEHDIFRQTFRGFVDKELAPHAEEFEKAEATPKWVWTKLGEPGFLALDYPPEYGGQDCDFMFKIIFAEELPRCNSFGLVTSIITHCLAASVPHKFGTQEMKNKYVKPALLGNQIAALAMTEPDAGSDLASIKSKAEKTKDGWLINGQKMFITNGTIADFLVIIVRTTPGTGYKGMSCLLVEKDTPGFSSLKLDKLGLKSSETAELTFDNCLIPLENLIGIEDRGFYQMMWNLVGERILAAASSVGRGKQSFDLALDYVQQRIQFGNTIASNQSIQHRFADMATNLEAARQLTYYSAWLYENGGNPIKESSMAKILATQTAFSVTDDALQMFGGYGYMMDSPIQRHWRDNRVSRITAGTDEIQKGIIAGQFFAKA